jgi:phosphatidylglycerol---prolipoprotein diacylglyceryl transferase
VTFPVDFVLGPLTLSAHQVFEFLAYLLGFQIFLLLRRRSGDVVAPRVRWSIVAAAILGGALGSRLLFWLEDPAQTLARLDDPAFLLGGKTVVGGLIGGLLGVELTKKVLGVAGRTGDLFALPLAVGIAVGRIGCFLAGLSDRTFGIATSLPWAVDFGDGIRRHPTQLYEAVFLAGLAVVLAVATRRRHPPGSVFRLFMMAYLAFRVLVDAIKPDLRLALGLSAIQWAALLTLTYYVLIFRQQAALTIAD